MKKRVVTISREFGSGGRTVGKLVAQRLGWKCYDKELVLEIARRSGFDLSFIQEHGEYAFSRNSFLFDLSAHGSAAGTLSVYDQLYIAQHNIIAELAQEGNCVIVGRCADYILKDREDCLHAFVHAPVPFRADRIVRMYGERTDAPEKRLKDKDSRRKTYYRHYTGRPWGVMQNYHICLDSSVVGVETCARMIAEAAEGEGEPGPAQGG